MEFLPTDIAPRNPESCVIEGVLRAHLDEFLERVSDETDGSSIPDFVRRELRAIQDCGDFMRGFSRLRCDSCRSDRIVPFSCKSRVCPSCAGRRMSDTAAWLVDRVLRPDIGWRQYVVTFPAPLAVGLCFREKLASAVVRVCMRVLSEHQRARARAAGTDLGPPQPGAIVWIQRFSDGAGSWYHLHILTPDGVFHGRTDRLAVVFAPQPAPTQREVDRLAENIARRVTKLVARHAGSAPDDALLARCAEQPAIAVRVPTPPPSRTRPPYLLGQHQGFTVHAATAVKPGQPEALERLVRYLGRPPLAKGRVERTVDGRVAIQLKRPRRGVTRFLFEPIAFIARLAALIPPRKSHQTRYFGVYAAASPLRSLVLPEPPEPTPTRPVAPKRPQRMRHADLLMRVFLVDVLACPCGGRLRLIAVLTNPDVVQIVAAAIILSHQQPARAPPERGQQAT